MTLGRMSSSLIVGTKNLETVPMGLFFYVFKKLMQIKNLLLGGLKTLNCYFLFGSSKKKQKILNNK